MSLEHDERTLNRLAFLFSSMVAFPMFSVRFIDGVQRHQSIDVVSRLRGLLDARITVSDVPIDIETLKHVGQTLACEDHKVGHMLLSTIEKFEAYAVLEKR